MSGVSLNGGVESPFGEAVKEKPGLPWKPKGVKDATVVRTLLRKTVNRKWNQPKRKKYVAVNKAEMILRSEKCFDIKHEDAQFEVCPVGFCLFWSYAFFPFLEWEYTSCAIICCEYVICLILQETIVKIVPESEKRI